MFDTAAQAARALGMKPVTVRAHESGQNQISAYDLERYARRYGISINWLLRGDGPDIPVGTVHEQFGEWLEIAALIEDGVWLKDDPTWHQYPVRIPRTPSGEKEFTIYTDPRFPATLVDAFKVVTSQTEGAYINGTLVFAVPRQIIGYRPGDHVVIVREDTNNNTAEWTLRRVDRSPDGAVQYTSLLSSSPPFGYSDSEADGVLTDVVGVVVGSLTRRPTNELTVEQYASSDLLDLDRIRRSGDT